MEGAAGGLLMCLMAVVAVVGVLLMMSRSQSLLQGWADENGYRIIDSDARMLAKGPFFWTSSSGQSIYRVTVEDASGRRRSGYVRLGSLLGGILFSDKSEVRWDDQGE